MKKHHISVILFIVLAAVVWLFAPRIIHRDLEIAPVLPQGEKVTVIIGDAAFNVGVADAPAEREQGLSGRAGLAPDEGLLFVFEKPGIYSFWMKDMLFPIDIIWIGEDMRVVYVKERATPKTYPEIFTPDDTALYVLEVNTGVVAEKKIEIGDEMTFDIAQG